ncbi:interleukin-18 receptor accessory protein-like isoform X2 [Embiotoca jacksoni]
MMPCVNKSLNEQMCSKAGEGNKGAQCFDCGEVFQAEAKHSGKYTSLTGGQLAFHLQVVERVNLGCFHGEESKVNLRVNIFGKISCPGLTCSNNTDVIWYKHESMLEKRISVCKKGGWLHFCQVRELDFGVYFCDSKIIEQGVTWIFRTAVNVRVIPYHTVPRPPRITYPNDNMTEEVELGRPHNLTCEVYFPFKIQLSPKVQWYTSYGDSMEKMTPQQMLTPQPKKMPLGEYGVRQRAIITEVTPQHLDHTYTCITSNTVGSNSVTIKLIRKLKERWPPLVGYTIASFLLVAGMGIILHVKWLELQLIYRSHFQYGKHDGEEKEFDVFLSYVWSPPTTAAKVMDGLTFSSRSGTFNDEEACLCSLDLLTSREGKATQRPLEVLLPQVLEDQWGYRLCLLERDVLPGGAYTNDVVLAIQRSRMLICVLSADYLANSNTVFVLESGVQALLQKSELKLLLIWTNGASASISQPDPPLPALVRRALRVLPSLDWSSDKPARPNSNFWRSLKKAMPTARECGWSQSFSARD